MTLIFLFLFATHCSPSMCSATTLYRNTWIHSTITQTLTETGGRGRYFHDLKVGYFQLVFCSKVCL